MCENPFWKCDKEHYKVAVIIIYKGEQLAICEECWNKIADSDLEWGEEEHACSAHEQKL